MDKKVISYLKNLIKDKYIYKKNKNYFLKFKNFKSLKIDTIIIKTSDIDKILILNCGEAIFEYWINQKLLIPPWETHWFQLKDNFLLKLKNELLNDLINKGIKKAGNLNKLCKLIKLSVPTFYNFINNKNNIKMVSIKKLRRLLDYLNINYTSFNDKIGYTKKGNKISIKNPKFPINLLNQKGAKMLGNIVSDGCIYLDKKARNTIRTKYCGDKESINNFIECINNIYGNVHINTEKIRNCIIIKIGSSIIGNSLLKCGAILGHKAKMNKGVPWLIKISNGDLKKSYLQAAFDDESSPYYYTKSPCGSYIIMSRYRHLNNLTINQKKILEKLDKFMTTRKFPTGHIDKKISIKKAKENIKGNKELIKNINLVPKLLLDESIILKSIGIDNRLWGRNLNKTSAGNYSTCFDLFISKKNALEKFYKEIGFSLKYKQKKLIKIIGGENYIKTI